jgi:hypothetical protein
MEMRSEEDQRSRVSGSFADLTLPETLILEVKIERDHPSKQLSKSYASDFTRRLLEEFSPKPVNLPEKGGE